MKIPLNTLLAEASEIEKSLILSENAKKVYTRSLKQWYLLFEKQGIVDLTDLDLYEMKQVVFGLKSKKMSNKSIALMLSPLRRFLDKFVDTGTLPANVARDVYLKSASQSFVKHFQVDELQIFFSNMLAYQAKNDKQLLLWQRDLAMLELFYGSGMRLSELVALDLKDIFLSQLSLQVTGKGNKERRLPIGNSALQALENWLKVRAQLLKQEPTEALFLSTLGKRIHARSVQKRLEFWQKELGLNKRLHPHRLRHSFASHLLASSSELKAVQELLGHENLSTTQIYTHLDYQKLAQVYDQFHPRSKKKE